jgi:uncharacterized membrane protein
MQRKTSERILQTAVFEAGGMLIAVPLYNALFGNSSHSGLGLLFALTIAVLIITPLHNMIFDKIEYRLTGRPASERPHHLRLLHAISHEATPVVVTLPLVMIIGGHSFAEALAVEIWLTLLYIGYAYFFYLAYDRLRPMRQAAA